MSKTHTVQIALFKRPEGGGFAIVHQPHANLFPDYTQVSDWQTFEIPLWDDAVLARAEAAKKEAVRLERLRKLRAEVEKLEQDCAS